VNVIVFNVTEAVTKAFGVVDAVRAREAAAGFPFTGSAIISGSLQVTGSVSVNTTSGEEFAVTPTGIKVGNTVTDVYIKVSGTWKQATAFIKIGGNWK
jgi:hypothetical protein